MFLQLYGVWLQDSFRKHSELPCLEISASAFEEFQWKENSCEQGSCETKIQEIQTVKYRDFTLIIFPELFSSLQTIL